MMQALVPANPETVGRLLEQGTYLITDFRNAFKEDPESQNTAFRALQVTGWKHTLIAAYGKYWAEEIHQDAERMARGKQK